MKKFLSRSLFVFAAIFLLNIVSCSNSNDEVSQFITPSLFDNYAFPDAPSVRESVMSVAYYETTEQKIDITTTYLTGWENVPFLSRENVGILLDMMNFRGYFVSKLEDRGFYYKYSQADAGTKYPAEWKDDTMYFDVVNQTIYSDEFTRMVCIVNNVNNGIGGDVVGIKAAATAANPVIKESSQTTQVRKKNGTTIKLSDYGLKMFKIGEEVYVPFAVLAGVFSQYGVCVFNGENYFIRMSTDVDTSSDIWNTYAKGYGKGATRSQLMAEYNYRNLCMLFDLNYCLKNQRAVVGKDNITTFHSSIKANGLYDGLVSSSAQAYSDTLVQFLMGYIDDGHTMYTAPSLWGIEQSAEAVSEKMDEKTGLRRKTLRDTTKRLSAAREKVGAGVDAFWLAENGVKKMAVITFDGFNDNSPGDETDLEKLGGLNTYAFLKQAFNYIENVDKEHTIKNVVLDLTNNGGGALVQCMLALRFLADSADYYIPIRNCLDDSVTKFYYSVEENLKKDYHFYVMTSNFSFSCGNFFPSVCKYQLNIPIIGQQSGGGGGTVKLAQTADGALFRTSGAFEMCSIDESGNYQCIDNGVPVDLEISEDQFYAEGETHKNLYGALYEKLAENYADNFKTN